MTIENESQQYTRQKINEFLNELQHAQQPTLNVVFIVVNLGFTMLGSHTHQQHKS